MISVCIATYNGEKYLRRQIDSIMCQMGFDDELVISDDSSTDGTVDIIQSCHDQRIKLYEGQKFHSPIFNFENAIKHAKGDIIFLADQDDKWWPDRVENALKMHKSGYDLVICNTRTVYHDHVEDGRLNPFGRCYLLNLWKPAYIGCTMSFNREILEMVLPFPKSIAMHDLWIGLLAQRNYKCGYIEEPLIEYNRHEESFVARHPMSTTKRIQYRLNMLWQVLKREKVIRK